MTNLEFTLWLAAIILVGYAGIAALEWNDPNPPKWVVKSRMWLAQKKRQG